DGDVDGDGERDIDVRSGGRNIGLIHVTGGHAQLNGFTLSNGSSTSYSTAGVGGIEIDSGAELTLSGSRLSGNYSYKGVAAVQNAGTATIVGTEFTGGRNYLNAGGLNLATTGIHNLAGATLSLSDSTFTGNGINLFYSSIQAQVMNEGTATLNNVTFQNNGGYRGGAFQNFAGATAQLSHVTATGNTARGNYYDANPPSGGVINDAGASLTLSNSILTGNRSHRQEGQQDLQNFGELTLVGGNVITDEFSVDGVVQRTGLTAEDVFDSVSLIWGASAGELADNGGPVRTVALKSGLTNPAIDSGDDSEAPALDARGESREDHAEITNRDGNTSDLGAFELPAGTVMFSSLAGAARGSVDVPEGTTSVVDLSVVDDKDSEGSGITYAISGGDDATAFVLDTASGVLTLASVPDFETPTDANGDSVYEVEIEATDTDGTRTTQTVEAVVTDIAETFVVDNIGDTADGDYSAGELTLREAIGFANADSTTADTITFAAEVGDAFENGATIRLQSELLITGLIDIQGAGNVFITADTLNNDILDADGYTDVDATLASTAADSDGIDNDGDGLIDSADTDGENLLDDNSRIFNIKGLDSTTSLSGLTLTGGRVTGQSEWGGAVLHDGPLTLTDSTVNGNSTSGFFARGGAISGAYYSYAPLTVVNSTISNNRAAGNFSGGGGLTIWAGDFYIKDSTVSGNHSMGWGGGILAYFSPKATVINTKVNDNHTTGYRAEGGGMWAAQAVITDSEFRGNTTSGKDAKGGGIAVDRSLSLTNVIVDDNHTYGEEAQGGGIYMSYMTGGISLHNLTITNNSTSGTRSPGGGIYIRDRDATLTDSVIANNSTSGYGSGGGGISQRSGTLTVRNSQFTDNATTGYKSRGGGIRAHTLNLTDSTVSGNSTMGDRSWGGGLEATRATVTNSHIADNQTHGLYSRGGGIALRELTLSNSTVSDNSTHGPKAGGGGVYASVILRSRSSTISGNATYGYFSPGGGLYNTRDMYVTNTTVTGNSTHGELSIGGGLYHEGFNSSHTEDGLYMSNSVVLGNVTTHLGVDGDDLARGIHSNGQEWTGGNIVGTNVFQDETDIGDTSVDEVFASLVDNHGVLAGVLDDNGGSQLTVALKATASNPAINNGDNSLQNRELDGRGSGFDRVRAGTVDLGSFEIQNDAPVISSDGGGETATVSIVENTMFVTDVASADDSDFEGSGLVYSLTEFDGGGADNALFVVDSITGELTFTSPPDHENPLDNDGDNIYEVQITVTDATGGKDTQSISVEVTNAPVLEVESVEINDGESQRSMVHSIAVTFNRADVIADASAFEIINTATGETYTPIVTTAVNAGQTTAVLTFGGAGATAASIADGTYRLMIKAELIESSAEMDNDHVDEFFQRFGDSNGDGIVNAVDYLAFRRTYRRSTGDALFNDIFDSDGDGDVDTSDFLAFRRNYLR
ncbi:MAG: right-handed parallel beta-helix repeat-containing protein, partial [Fuerstiella sp.]